MRPLFFVIAISILLTGCVSNSSIYKGYQGDPLPYEQTSTLIGYEHSNNPYSKAVQMEFLCVNGIDTTNAISQFIYKPPYKVSLKPGTNYIHAVGGGSSYKGTARFNFEADAGHTYQVESHFRVVSAATPYKVETFKIKDQTTGIYVPIKSTTTSTPRAVSCIDWLRYVFWPPGSEEAYAESLRHPSSE